ncbi:MAG: iron ABC transporter permease [Coriobacteriales bacterium]|jgi:iron complex transport system permease protein|nr:iron ABC transporter permease [Coriobacteriales bacterium]
MAVVLLLCILFSVSIGVAGGGIGSLFHALVQSLVHPSDLSDIGRIMLEMRIPRALAACLVGAALALAGAVMQGITRNPLADAGLLGINAGAGLFVALGAVILPALSSFSLMLASFFGAAAAALMVFGFGTGRHGAGTIRLILAGAAVSAFLTALSQGVSLTFGLSKELSFWGSGSLSGISWEQLAIAAPWLVGAVCAGLFLSHNLSMLALGEESAAGLGLNVRLVRLAGLATVLVLAGTSVSLAGGISFLGLIVPHSARLLVGTDYRRVLPVSVFLGAILLVLSDVAARMIHAPFDTPVGALVSIIGVPVLLALTYRKRGLAL